MYKSFKCIEDFLKDGGFECNVDLPVIQYIANVKIKDSVKGDRFIKFTLHYDYLFDKFFAVHPYRLSLAEGSYLTQKCYDLAKNDSIDCVENAFIKSIKSVVESVVIDKTYPYITSYKFEGKFENNKILFRFPRRLLIDKNYVNNHKYNVNRQINIKWGIKECYSRELFEFALKQMAKFKFSYKSDSFESPKIVNTTLLEGDEILLPKYYYLLSSEGKLDDSYLPSMIKFDNDLFDEPIELPVLIKRKNKKI